jgi:hypothetical protein
MAMRPLSRSLLASLASLLLSLAGCTAPSDPLSEPPAGSGSSTESSGVGAPASSAPGAVDCRGHRHATFAVFVPGEGGMRRIDLGAPKDAQGRAYYQLGIAPNMTVAVHMHQQGSEVGSSELATSQMHYESPGSCGTLDASLRSVDMVASDSGLTVAGAHGGVGQAGQWASNATHRVHLSTRPAGDDCAWSTEPLAALADDVADGMSFLVAFGAPTPAEVAAMQATVPRPMGHEPCA